MNKKYIDFVPVKSEEKSKGKSTSRKAPKTSAEQVEADGFVVSEIFEERTEKTKAGVTTTKKYSVVTPRAKFVNTEKVAKRPLSKSAKNVYTKKVVEPKENTPVKPVKIIDKPEKDSKMGLVAAIIITIILGAAAGTVAFLLLPK